jgi:hypothetical protein
VLRLDVEVDDAVRVGERGEHVAQDADRLRLRQQPGAGARLLEPRRCTKAVHGVDRGAPDRTPAAP